MSPTIFLGRVAAAVLCATPGFLTASAEAHDGPVSVRKGFALPGQLVANARNGTVELVRKDGKRAFAATVDGRRGISFARVQWAVPPLGEGSRWSTSFSVFVPLEFLETKSCTFQPFGWDTWPIAGNQMRLMVGEAALGAMVLRRQYKNTRITPKFSIPGGRWVQIDIEQRISRTDGETKVRLDGKEVAATRGPTYADAPVSHFRYGIADCTGQNRPATVYVRDLSLAWSLARL